MGPELRSSSRRGASCWTCRLRHKRCDAARPVCGGCTALGIRCHHSDIKPAWMDNGDRQRAAASRVGEKIKRAAARRRRARAAPQTSRAGAMPQSPLASEESSTDDSSIDEPGNDLPGHRDASGHLPSLRIPRPDTVSTSSATPANSVPSSLAPDSGDSSLHVRSELDISSAMCFIDSVFPTLYPFYRPALLDGGRSWLLVLLVRSRSFLSTVISLVSYFLSVVPVAPEDGGRLICNEITWDNLMTKMEDSVAALQGDLGRLETGETPLQLLPRVRILANMLQLLKLEVLIGSSEMWKMHLDAAVELFKQMLDSHDGSQFVSPLLAIQERMVDMPDAGRPPPSMGTYSNAHQSSFRFSAAILLYNDIVSSTVLGQSPRLRRYHSDLLGDGTASSPSLPGMLLLEDFVGCQNWALLQISAIASLDAWKTSMIDRGQSHESFQRELDFRGEAIRSALLQGLSTPSANLPSTTSGAIFRHLQTPAAELHRSRTISTQIWGWAAYAYLHTVTYGWKPKSPHIRCPVKGALHRFEEVKEVSHMATLIWPLCVAACLCEGEQRSFIRGLVASMEGLQRLGVMKDVLKIAEDAWASDDSASYSVKACLSRLGHRALLA